MTVADHRSGVFHWPEEGLQMLTRWRLENFKSVRHEIEIELRPLTVLTGANSSGKSTLLQSVLLIQQTTTHPIPTKALVLNGRLLRLGSFSEVLSRGATTREVAFGFQYQAEENEGRFGNADENMRTLSCDMRFTATTDSESPELAMLQAALKEVHLSTVDKDGHKQSMRVRASANSAEERATEYGLSSSQLSDDDRQMLRYEVEPATFASPYRFIDDGATVAVGARLWHFLPTSCAIIFDRTTYRARTAVEHLLTPRFAQHLPFREVPNSLALALKDVAQEYVSSAQPSSRRELMERLLAQQTFKLIEADGFMELLRAGGAEFRAFLDQHRERLVQGAKGGAPTELAIATVPSPMEDALAKSRELFTERIRYLGPLRDEPRPYYPLEGAADPTDVGMRGEYTAAVLHLNKQRIVSYVPAADHVSHGRSALQTFATLHKAVIDWLTYMGVLTDVTTQDRGVFGHEMRVATDGTNSADTLVHVGVGVSQVLPILVMSLIAPQGSVLIFEQPELHLHPRVQARLGDFFLAMTRAGKQCLVETHSEYLVNRIRLRTAEDMSDEIAGRVRLYNVEKIEGVSRYQNVKLNEYGSISDWPKGFFDHLPDESERILRAALDKKRQRRPGAS